MVNFCFVLSLFIPASLFLSLLVRVVEIAYPSRHVVVSLGVYQCIHLVHNSISKVGR